MTDTSRPAQSTPAPATAGQVSVPAASAPEPAKTERPAPDPTRYGDWEKNGRCIDF